MENSLAKCPFCGIEPIKSSLGDNWNHPNTDCILGGVIMDVNQWNTRPTEDALRKRVGELEGWIKSYADHAPGCNLSAYMIGHTTDNECTCNLSKIMETLK